MSFLSRRVVLALMFVALLVSALPAASVHAAGNTQYVSAYLDSPGTLTDCRTVAANCNLRNALNAAADGDTIQFVQGVFGWPITYTLDPANGTLAVSHSVVIQGPGVDNLKVSGGKAVTVFTVNRGVTATISALTITDGNNTGSFNPGGGIFNLGTLTVAGSVIQNNSAPNGLGGGIDNAGTLTLTDCTIGGNISAFGGGVSSGTLGFNATSLTITGSRVTGNTAMSGAGGGIFTYGIGTNTITASTIQGNNATSGGGIANGTSVNGNGRGGSAVTISGSTVRDNQATGTGGGIYNNGAIGTQGNLTLINATLSGNQAGGNGGGLFNELYTNFPATATLIATTVSNNRVSGGGSSGGGINDASGAITTLTASLVAGNLATGGATAPDLANAVTSGGHNLIGVGTGSTGIMDGANGDHVGTANAPIDPKLSSLADNGGPTATHALLPNSPAIEAGGSCPGGVTTDQRGQARVANCDSGAFEYQPVVPTVSGTATAPASGGSATFHGTGFQTASQLTIGTTSVTAPASGVSDDGTTFTVTVPAHSAGSVSVVVANPRSGAVAAGVLAYQPVVTSLSTTSGSNTGGSSVIIRGVGFAAGNTNVMFGNTPATVTNVTPTTITVTVPAHAVGTVDVTVTVNGASGTKTGAYTYGTVNPVASPRPPSGSPVTGTPVSAPLPHASVGMQPGAAGGAAPTPAVQPGRH